MRMKFHLPKRFHSLHARFLIRVLTPPFLVLLVISFIAFYLLNVSVRASVNQEMYRQASTTAAALEREIVLRETVLTTTGSELFHIKTGYTARQETLRTQYERCLAHTEKTFSFRNAPNNACDPFLAQFAKDTSNPSQAADNGYVEQGNELTASEQLDVSERLDAYAKFFPETLALLVTDKEGNVVSQAAGSDFSVETDKLTPYIKTALSQSIHGQVFNDNNRQALFAYPIQEGSVLAVYNMDHPRFFNQVWKIAPIDNSKAYAIIVNQDSSITYPQVDATDLYASVNTADDSRDLTAFVSNEIHYLAISDQAGKTGWRVVIGSPSGLVLEPVRNAQIAAVIIIGLLLVCFLWLGAVFVHRTVNSIVTLAGGALIFASNRLEYRIKSDTFSDEEFVNLASTMNHMAERIQVAEYEIDQKNKEFINIATHELKAPMTAIIGNLSMVLEDGVGTLDSQARQMTSQAYNGTIRLRNLVTDLLDIARLESGKATFSLQPLDLNKEISDMIEIQRPPATQKQIVLDYNVDDSLPKVTADQNKLQVILTNFISNGIKYNNSPGTVRITAKPEGDMLVVSVADTGLGIPKEQQANMFKKFFRVSGDDRSHIPGTGLGMYITKQFIEAMGGRLWFESGAGEGTTFFFTLPIHNNVEKTGLGKVTTKDSNK